VSAKKTQAQPGKKVQRAKPAQPEAAPQPEQGAAAPAPQAEPQAAAPAAEAKGARTLTGRVVSNKMQKTIAVEIERLIRHPTYGKYIRRTTKLLAHDENGTSKEGDLVIIAPCRPMSRRKSWRLLEVVQRASGT
jgi:small subunit ribosomal protein S17